MKNPGFLVLPQLLELMPSPVVVVEAGIIAIVNPVARAFGFTERIRLEEISTELATLADRAIQTARATTISECALDGDGGLRVFRAEIIPFEPFEIDSRSSRCAIFLTDVTALTETSDELARLVIDSEIADRRLKNNLGYLTSLARLGGRLLETSDPEAIAPLLETALEETELFDRVAVFSGDKAPGITALSEEEQERIHRILRDPSIDFEKGRPLATQALRGRDRHYGVIAVWRKRDLLEEEFDLQPFASLAAFTLDNILMYNDLRAHNVAVQYLNEELSGTVRDLKAANEMKSRFVSIVSHEFRTPLTAISSYAETLYEDFESIDVSTTRSFLSVIKDETARLTRLINQLLDLSRIQARDRPLARERIELVALVEKVERAIQPVMTKKRLTFDCDIAAGSGVIIGDTDAIQQVLVNLLGNATRYTPEKGRIELSVTGDADFTYIHVRDTGVGIPDDSLDAIFSEFYTVPRSRIEARADALAGERIETLTGGTGTGLGLSIARAIVERHDGTITVRSQVGAGSEFSVKLPKRGRE